MVAVGVAGHLAGQRALPSARASQLIAVAPSPDRFAFSFTSLDGNVVNRFTIDDIVPAWSKPDDVPHPGRRLGGFANFRTDPYER